MMKASLFLFALVLSVLVAQGVEVAPCFSHEPIKFTVPSKPGFTTAFSQNGLNYFKDVGLQVLQKELAHIVIPDINGTAKTVVGKISYNINKISIQNLQFQQSSIEIQDSGLRIQISQASAKGGLGWHYRENAWPHVQGTGMANITVALTADILISFSSVNNHLQISKVVPNVKITDLGIHVSGKGSWFYNFLVDVLHGLIKSQISSALDKAMSTSIESGLNNLLMKVPVRQQIWDPVIFDIGMVKDPLFQKESFTLFEAGDSYNANKPEDCPESICPQRDLPSAISNKMVTMYMSDFVANSLGFAMVKAQKLKYAVDSDLVPSSSPFKLNTNSLAAMIPPLYAKYPNRNISLLASISDVPQIVFTPGGALIPKVPVSIEFYVVLDNSKELAFTLGGLLNTSASAALNGWVMTAKIGTTVGTWSITQSNIGTIDPKPLGNLMKFAIAFGIPPINEKLQTGIQLPTAPGLQFVNPSLKWGQNFLNVETDITYTPQGN